MSNKDMIKRIEKLARLTYDTGVPWAFALCNNQGKVLPDHDTITRYCSMHIAHNISDWRMMPAASLQQLNDIIEGMLNTEEVRYE